ncbi:MAG: rhodanese-like domain-containing protein [Rhodospirillales bacterium]
METPKKIAATELKRRLQNRQEVAIVDVREEDTFSARHLLMVSCLPLSRLETMAPRLLPRLSLPIVICDDGGGLAERGYARLKAGGYTDLAILDGGVDGWAAAGYRLYSGVHVPSKAFAEVVEHECHTPYLSAEQVNELIESKADIAIFDSRSYEEYHTNSLPTATSVPGAELVYRFHDLVPSKDTLIIVNCGGRTRSIIGAQALINAGVPNKVVSMKDGTMAWHLGGYDVVAGAARYVPPVSAAGLADAQARAEKVARKFAVPEIDHAQLEKFRAEAVSHTLYVLDVRTPEECQAGHLPGTVSVPGGQLVQETDNWIASWEARVVLVDDTGVRARMTASWLKQMGFAEVYVLKNAMTGRLLNKGAGTLPAGDFPPQGSAPQTIDAHSLDRDMKAGKAAVVDVGISKPYGKAHIPGAWHAVRSRLKENLSKLPKADILVFTADDIAVARHAAAEVAKLGRKTALLEGGNAAWKASGFKTESGQERMLDEADDIWLPPRERKTERERHMREYLSWEIDLVNQMAIDDDSRIGAVK